MNQSLVKKAIGVVVLGVLVLASIPTLSYAAASARTGNVANIQPLSATLSAEIVADTQGKTWMNVHTVWFDYGDANAGGIFIYHTQSRGHRTSTGETFVASETIRGLTPDTTYLYRVVVRNELGHVTYGVTRSFRTLPDNRVVFDTGTVDFGNGSGPQSPASRGGQSTGTVVPSPTQSGNTPQAPAQTGGTTPTPQSGTTASPILANQGSAYLGLSIENERDEIAVGDIVAYKVSVKNISSVAVNQVFIQIDTQDELGILETERGAFSGRSNSIFVEQGKMDAGETESFIVTTQLRSVPEKGRQVAARVTVLYTNPISQAQDQVIAFDIDDVRSGQLVATASTASFLPDTFIEWVIALILITLIIILGRKLYDTNKKKKEEEEKEKARIQRERELLTA